MTHFKPGQVIVHRDLFRGAVWYARAETVAEDTTARALLYWGPGAEVHHPFSRKRDLPLRIPLEEWTLKAETWHSYHVLCHWRPGDRYTVWLFWNADGWGFEGWYINLQSPFERTRLGFDTTDDILDIEVEPDGEWAWKDEDELEESVRLGLISEQASQSIRENGLHAVERMSSGAEPFSAEWIAWRPDSRWPTPRLLVGWEIPDSG
jgi:predicted RNA-binding protein associated with RNAse of E/G family